MSINVKYIEDKGFEPLDILIMEMLNQNSSEDMSEPLGLYLDKDHLVRLLEANIISTVQPKTKTEHEFRRLRLSKEGKKILSNARILDFTELDEKLLEAVRVFFTSLEKPIGNEKIVKQLLAWFRSETGYTRRQIYRAIKVFISIEQEQSQGKYIPSLENLLWKGKSVFSTKWDLADSKLYQFIQENKKLLNAHREGKK